MRNVIAIGLFCLAVPMFAAADTITYSKCALNDGKTLTDIDKVFKSWRVAADKDGYKDYKDYKLRILIPHAASDTAAGTFWLEGSAPSFARSGAAFDWWYSDSDAAASLAAMNSVFTCESSETFRTGSSF
jgi:hypothetical protein